MRSSHCGAYSVIPILAAIKEALLQAMNFNLRYLREYVDKKMQLIYLPCEEWTNTSHLKKVVLIIYFWCFLLPDSYMLRRYY